MEAVENDDTDKLLHDLNKHLPAKLCPAHDILVMLYKNIAMEIKEIKAQGTEVTEIKLKVNELSNITSKVDELHEFFIGHEAVETFKEKQDRKALEQKNLEIQKESLILQLFSTRLGIILLILGFLGGISAILGIAYYISYFHI